MPWAGIHSSSDAGAALIGQANSEDQVAIDQFEAAIADLTARRNEMHAARNAQARLLKVLTDRRHTLDTELASLELGAAHAEARSELAAAIRRQQDEATSQAATRPTVVALTSAAPSTPAPAPVAPTPQPAPPAGSGGVSPLPRPAVPRVHPGP